MPPETTLLSLIHWQHALGFIATILGVMGGYHRLFVTPEQRRRENVAQRLQELEKKQALQEQRLDSGNTKFDEVLAAIRELKAELKGDHAKLEERMRAIENAVAASVWRGVGEQR